MCFMQVGLVAFLLTSQGVMLTPSGPKTLEYNCRFGDPETQVFMSTATTDVMIGSPPPA